MSAARVLDSLLAIIPVAATTAVAAHAFGLFAKPIKESKNQFNWL